MEDMKYISKEKRAERERERERGRMPRLTGEETMGLKWVINTKHPTLVISKQNNH